MRESLTALAGLLVLALLTALIGPGFVDWRTYRPQIEARLAAALGVETHVGGGIGVRLLPSPRLTLEDVRIGGDGEAASSVAVERLTVELALSALARGEFRFSDVQADGATLTAVIGEAGGLRLPQRGLTGLPANTALDRLSLRRAALLWREPGKETVTLSPVAAELSAVSLGGPWRIEGEIAGASLRITTGAIEPDGRVRAKASLTGEATQLSFDGAFVLPAAEDGVALALDGAFAMTPGGAVTLSGRVVGGARRLDLTGLSLDIAGGAAKLEGEGRYLPTGGIGSLSLRARRLDLDALALALAERPGFERTLSALPGPVDVSLDLDQVIWRGEDFSAFALRGRLDEGGLSGAAASLRFAGALFGMTGAADPTGVAGRLDVKAEDARRLALVLARAGLDPALADIVADLGKIDAEAVGAWDGGRIGLERLLLIGSSGVRLEGSGDLTAGRLVAKVALAGLDLNRLPPGETLAGVIGGRDLALDLALTQARYRDASPGAARLDLRREGTAWRLSRLAVDGFGGISVTGSGALLTEGGEIGGRVRAPRVETLVALAGPLLPDALRQGLARAGDALSRLDAGFRLTRTADAQTTLLMEGGAQAGQFALDGRLDRDGAWSQASLRFDVGDRRQVFAALGLPSPQIGGAGRFSLERLSGGGLRGSLVGPGLSLALDGVQIGDARLTVQAERSGQIMPEGLARLLPDDLLDASGRLGVTATAIALDDLVVNIGGASVRGALALAREGGAVSGRLTLPGIDLSRILGGAIGAGMDASGATWSSARFGPVAQIGDVRLAIDAGSLTVAEGVRLSDARFTLAAGGDGVSIENLTGRHGGGTVTGRLTMRREGGLAQLSGRLGFAGLDLGGLTKGALAGTLTGEFDAGGSGESPARLIAGLSGSGSLRLGGASLARFDPGAYSRVIADTGEDASESEASRLQGRLGDALDRAAWRLGDVAAPFTLAGGLARLQPFAFDRDGLRAEASGLIDLRALSADLRLALRPLGPLPKGWPGDAPRIVVSWRGPLAQIRREADVGALSNAVAARALAREIERVEAFEADARERAAHARRLRAEREMRENQRQLAAFLKAEEERRIAEEKRAEEARKVEEARLLAEEKRAEEARRVEEARRLAEERRAEIARRAAEARQDLEDRRRAEAEETARAAAARAASQQPRAGPLVLPGAPRSIFDTPAETPAGVAPPPAPPIEFLNAPQPLSRGLQPN